MERTGVWLVGARGSIAVTTLVGCDRLLRGAERTGLVTERPGLEQAGLLPFEGMVFGGHEIRSVSLVEEAKRCLGFGLTGAVVEASPFLEAVDEWIKPGVARGGGPRVEDHADRVVAGTDLEVVTIIRRDLDEFKAAHKLARLVMINLSSTEPTPPAKPSWSSWAALEAAMASDASQLPPSSLYACAALLGGDGFVNFTPSLGADVPALKELALQKGAPHAGSDGKTGETLIKSVLGELFLRRNLHVASWFGQNILGNGDGRVLDDPSHKATKIRSKDHLLPKILGYPTETRVGIDYVGSLGEWKIAWDHIHFRGFLGAPMSLQFTWQGLDSILAAPLVLDLARLVDLALRRGEKGVLHALAAFFKDPMEVDEQRLVSQDEALLAWVHGTP